MRRQGSQSGSGNLAWELTCITTTIMSKKSQPTVANLSRQPGWSARRIKKNDLELLKLSSNYFYLSTLTTFYQLK